MKTVISQRNYMYPKPSRKLISRQRLRQLWKIMGSSWKSQVLPIVGLWGPFWVQDAWDNYCLAWPWSVVTPNLVALPKTVCAWKYRVLQKCGLWDPVPFVWEGWGGHTKFIGVGSCAQMVFIGQTVGPWRSYKRNWVLRPTAWIMGWVSKTFPGKMP